MSRDGGWFELPGWAMVHKLHPDVVPATTLCGRTRRDGWMPASGDALRCIVCLRCRKRPFASAPPVMGSTYRRIDVIYLPWRPSRRVVTVQLPAVAHA